MFMVEWFLPKHMEVITLYCPTRDRERTPDVFSSPSAQTFKRYSSPWSTYSWSPLSKKDTCIPDGKQHPFTPWCSRHLPYHVKGAANICYLGHNSAWLFLHFLKLRYYSLRLMPYWKSMITLQITLTSSKNITSCSTSFLEKQNKPQTKV